MKWYKNEEFKALAGITYLSNHFGEVILLTSFLTSLGMLLSRHDIQYAVVRHPPCSLDHLLYFVHSEA